MARVCHRCLFFIPKQYELLRSSKREDQTRRRKIALSCRAQSKDLQICLGELKTAAIDAHMVRHGDRFLACKVLSCDSPPTEGAIEDKGKPGETAKDAIQSPSISDMHFHLRCGHIPGTGGTSAFLCRYSGSTIRKSRRKDEGLLAARDDTW